MPYKDPWNHKLGMLNRLSRIFQKDDRALIIAADHRQRGIQKGLENLESLTSRISTAIEYADALIATRDPLAALISSHPVVRRKGLLLSLNRTGLRGSAFEMDDRPVASPAQASRWGLDGAKFLLRIDPENSFTATQLEICGRICEECEDLQLPIVIEPLYCRGTESNLTIDSSPDKVRYAAIIASDFSVPAIKIPYPEGPTRRKRRDEFRDIVASVDSHVLMLGGRRTKIEELLARAADSVAVGGSGVVIGRNILLHDNPSLVTLALRMILHGDSDAKTALRKARKVLAA